MAFEWQAMGNEIRFFLLLFSFCDASCFIGWTFLDECMFLFLGRGGGCVFVSEAFLCRRMFFFLDESRSFGARTFGLSRFRFEMRSDVWSSRITGWCEKIPCNKYTFYSEVRSIKGWWFILVEPVRLDRRYTHGSRPNITIGPLSATAKVLWM